MENNNTKDKILKAAFFLFSEIGYSTTTTRMIAEKAGVSLSTIPYYFETKSNLHDAVLQIASKQYIEYLSPVPKTIEDLFSAGYIDIDKDTAQNMIIRLLNRHMDFVFDPNNEQLIRLILNEQFFNTEQNFYQMLYNNMSSNLTKLLMVLRPYESEERALITSLAVIGEVLVFNYHKSSILRALNIKEYSQQEIALIRETLWENLRPALGLMIK